jgi:spore maturation protein CgeB
MLCFEATGCAALLLSHVGKYPQGMDGDETMLTYETGNNCLDQIAKCPVTWSDAKKMADKGRNRISKLYSKEQEWALFRTFL